MITLLILLLQVLGGNYNNYQEESFNQRPLDSYTNCHTPLTGMTAACLSAPLAAPKRNMSPGVLFAAFLHSPCGRLPAVVVQLRGFLTAGFVSTSMVSVLYGVLSSTAEKTISICVFEILNGAFHQRQWFKVMRLIVSHVFGNGTKATQVASETGLHVKSVLSDTLN